MRYPLVIAPALTGLLSVLLPACRGAGSESAPPDASAPASAGPDAPVEEAREPSLKRLGPTERRVKVLVVPVDAQVEADGVPVRRRDGVIELVGAVGATHKLRVFRGAESTVQVVTLRETGADPALIDLEGGERRAGRALLDHSAIAVGLRHVEKFDE
jgi:hypothetical protein